MTVNVGSLDRLVRLIAGLILIVAALFSGLPLFAGDLLKWGAVAVGAVLVLTGTIRICPMYSVFGIRTNRT